RVVGKEGPPRGEVGTGKEPRAGAATPPASKPATPKTVARMATPKPASAGTSGNPQSEQSSVAPKAKPADAGPVTFAVQLAAPASEQEARALQARLMQKFGTELAGVPPTIRKAEVGGKTDHRVRVSGLSSRDQATALCQKLHDSGGDCFVAKN